MERLRKIRERIEPAVTAQQQRHEVARSTRHYAEFADIRSGYLRSRTEDDPSAFDALLQRASELLDRFTEVEDSAALGRAAAACVVWEQREEPPAQLWRPVWSESFDRVGEQLPHSTVDADKSAMLWRVAHLRTFGVLPSIERLTQKVRSPLDTVPFYVFVNAPSEELLNISMACLEEYDVLTADADGYIDARF